MMRRAAGRIARTLFGSITGVETTQSVVALTFDDGPDPKSTLPLLEILESRGAKGTFFMVGNRAMAHPEVVARVAAGGHAIGNHSWDHPSFPLLSRRERLNQLRQCARVLGQPRPRMFRPPYGHFDESSRLDLALSGFTVVTWNILEPDWLNRKAQAIAGGIIDKIQPGAIILLHDALIDALEPEYFNREETLSAVELLLGKLENKYRFVTVPELLKNGPARKVLWSQLPDRAFLKTLVNQAGRARSY